MFATLPDPAACYRVLQARDRRYDGLLFVGVQTTGIYCRPVCPARTPAPDHCRFFSCAAAAEREGFRPCLRCRPELAPGRAPVDAVERLATAALGSLQAGALESLSLAELAAAHGVTDRHLRRVVRSVFGVTPLEVEQTRRLLEAKRLLTDTRLSITEIAFASGFGSVRRFNHLFQQRYRMAPGRFRRTTSEGIDPDGAAPSLRFRLSYRPPLAWEPLLQFLAAHATPGVELVCQGEYLRTCALGSQRGWLRVGHLPERHALEVELQASLAPVAPAALRRIRRLFDLDAAPDAVAACLGDLPHPPGLRVPGAFSGFELGARTVLGQQVSVRAATTVAGRFAAALGEPLETPFPELNRLSPTAARVAAATEADVTALGMNGARARTLITLARAFQEGAVQLAPHLPPQRWRAALLALPGIGEWTADYLLLRGAAAPDAFPAGDLALRRVLGAVTAREAERRSRVWSPWRSYAAIALWQQYGSREETSG